MPSKKRTSPEEVGLLEAATLLGVSEKTMRTYIKQRRVRATKVAGTWYVDKSSVLSLGGTLADTAPPDAPAHLSLPSISPPPPLPTPTGHPPLAIHGLACYRLFLAALTQLSVDGESPDMGRFLTHTCREALAQLGAGYYGYGRSKRWHYESSRAAMGKVLAVMAADAALLQRHSVFATMLEKDVIPAFGPLLKRLERRDSDPGSTSKTSTPSAQVTDRVP